MLGKMLLVGGMALALSAPALAKHQCQDASGNEVKTAEGKTIKRSKTCKKNHGTWKDMGKSSSGKSESKSHPDTHSDTKAHPAEAPPAEAPPK
jgi:hypothetical protein